MTPEQAQPFESQPSGMSEISRVTGVFFEPAKTFEDVAARPTFWVPLVLVLLFATVYLFLLSVRPIYRSITGDLTLIGTN